jgi:hypothetical protein
MVLALSERTINHQFAQLLATSQIPAQWKLLVRRPRGGPLAIKTAADPDFDRALEAWRTTQDHLAKLFAAGHYAKYGEQLGAAIQGGLLWDYSWSATVAAPAIAVLPGDHLHLRFAVSFAGGSLAYNSDRTLGVSTYDLTGAVYAFSVPIGRLQIGGTGEILTSAARDQAAQVIRDSGLTDADFTIESLFLDFDNANVSSFDPSNSRFPAGATTPLQIAIEDYFKLILPGQGNPYILGYGMQAAPAAVRPQPRAMFQPTALRFSSSYSSTPGASALNYLLMLGGREFPPGQNVGILPASLLEGAGLDPSQDGMLAIDYPVFEQAVIDPFVAAINGVLVGRFGGSGYSRTGQQWSLSAGTSSSQDVSQPVSDMFQKTIQDTSQSVSSSIALTNALTGLVFAWSFDLSAEVSVHPWLLLAMNRVLAYDAKLSTSGEAQPGPGGHDGQSGTLIMTIQPGSDGKVQFQVASVQSPQLGYVQAPYVNPLYTVDMFLGALVLPLSIIDWIQGFGNGTNMASGVAGLLDSVTSSLQSAIDSLSLGKVILPLGQLYTFKAIQLLSNTNTDDNAVMMNVAYPPV